MPGVVSMSHFTFGLWLIMAFGGGCIVSCVCAMLFYHACRFRERLRRS